MTITELLSHRDLDVIVAARLFTEQINEARELLERIEAHRLEDAA